MIRALWCVLVTSDRQRTARVVLDGASWSQAEQRAANERLAAARAIDGAVVEVVRT